MRSLWANPRGSSSLLGRTINLCNYYIFRIKVIDWRENHKSAYAQTIKLIAKSKNPNSDYLFIAGRYGLNSFNKYGYDQKLKTKYLELIKREMGNRQDLTHLITFTIDPKTAMDFDDAISIKKEKNHIELYIHIADVTYFVKEGSKRINIDTHHLE